MDISSFDDHGCTHSPEPQRLLFRLCGGGTSFDDVTLTSRLWRCPGAADVDKTPQELASFDALVAGASSSLPQANDWLS